MSVGNEPSHDIMMACIKELPEPARDAVLLRFEGLSIEEISNRLGIKAGTAQARIQRVMPLLQKCVEARMGRSL